MEFVQTAISAAVVAAVGIVLGRLANQRFEALESGLAQFRGEVREEMARLESRLVDRIDGVESRLVDRIDALDAKLDSKIDSLRADLTQIALAVGAAPRRETG
jgi:predicted phage gp36 major capsid-like protein